MSELERALSFLELADHGGTREEPFRYGTALFDDRLPRRWDSNYLLVERVPQDVGAEELAEETERIQGPAGLRHRKLEVRDEAAGARLEPQFRRLGWTVSREPPDGAPSRARSLSRPVASAGGGPRGAP
jgi:hypothetical protein